MILVVDFRAIIAGIANAVRVAVLLAVVGNIGTVVLLVDHAVFVVVEIGTAVFILEIVLVLRLGGALVLRIEDAVANVTIGANPALINSLTGGSMTAVEGQPRPVALRGGFRHEECNTSLQECCAIV